MDVREKLVDICFSEFCMVAGDSPCGCDGCPYGKYGSENDECYEAYKKHKFEKLEKAGATVQEWISVKDRLPEEECRCLVIDAAGDIEMDCYDGKGRFVLDRSGAVQHPSHWMPLPKMPQSPKGE